MEKDRGPRKKRRPYCILCLGCGKTLDKEERGNARRKGLSRCRKYVNGYKHTFAACPKCCWEIAAKEANECQGTEIFLEADGVEIFENLSLDLVKIWCQFCLTLLTEDEKESQRDLKEPFLKRRGRWRGTCGDCLNSERNA